MSHKLSKDKLAITLVDDLDAIFVAGTIINGQRCLMLDNGKVIHYDPSVENNYDLLVGMSNHAAVVNEKVKVITHGLIHSANWGLTPNSVYYAGPNGTITTTAPVVGISVIVGLAINSETLKINVNLPIILT